MPNHCHNRVTFYSDDTTAILKLHKIWSSGLENDDDSETEKLSLVTSYQNLIGLKVPLNESTVQEYSFSKPRGEIGECPKLIINEKNPFCLVTDSLALANLTIGGMRGVVKTGELSGMLTP